MLAMRGIGKRFPGVRALDGMELEVRRGEVHAIVGENGAGKSTLMKILSGAYSCDEGQILLNGTEVQMRSPAEAIERGIGVIYQDLPLIPTLSVLANVYLGREVSGPAGQLKDGTLRRRFLSVCRSFGIYVDPDARVRDLSVSQRQQVEILKVLDRDASLIVMDEPTAALDEQSKVALFETVRRLRDQGKSFILITHFIDEVFDAADRVTVLKDGRHVSTLDISATTPSEVVSLMIGHSINDMFPPRGISSEGAVVLEARGLSAAPAFTDVSFSLRAGEILGLTGLVGSGGSELANALIGNHAIDSGTIHLDSEPVTIANPHQAIERGICLLPNDRKGKGILAGFEVYKNISLSSLARFSRRGVVHASAERENAQRYKDQLRIVTPSVEQDVVNLSGGNQQKVILSRMLSTDARIMILDEPTQGIDIHAKEEIFHLIRRLADQGKSILFISSEFKEVAGLADRSIVLSAGRIIAQFGWAEATEQRLIEVATTGHKESRA